MHYHRWYRHGDPLAVATRSVSTAKDRRYIATTRKGHPVADKHGNVWVHRVVLFDAIGHGPHPCHWCGRPLTWGGKGGGSLVVDHLDGDGANNTLTNLVPCCASCNTSRGLQERSAALKDLGFWSHHDTVAHCQAQQRKPSLPLTSEFARA
jgi:5-methylcytosine-specific restriction endonuclease McrA